MEVVSAVETMITNPSLELCSESNAASSLSSELSTTRLKTVPAESAVNLLAVHNQNRQFVIQQPLKTSDGPVLVGNGTAHSKGHMIVEPVTTNQHTPMPTAAAAVLGHVITPERAQKRPLTSSSSNVITKVIITKNSLSGQPQAVPSGASSQSIRLTSLPGGTVFSDVATGPQQQGGLPFIQPSSTKSMTLASHDALSSAQAVNAINPSTGAPKLGVPYQKTPTCPVKTPTKITMIPVSGSPSKQLLNSNITVLAHAVNSSAQAGSVALKQGSPSKVIIKQSIAPTGSSSFALKSQSLPTLAPQTAQSVRPSSVVQGVRSVQVAQNVRPVSVSAARPVQQLQVPGSRFHYVRLVTHPNSTESSTLPAAKLNVGEMTQAPVNVPPTSVAAAVTANQVQISLPFQQQNTPLAPKPAVIPASIGTQQNIHRIILPATSSSVGVQGSAATSLVPIQPAPSSSVSVVGQLPPGTAIISAANSNIQGLQSFALVPASYVTQLQQQLNRSKAEPTVTTASVAKQGRDYVPIASIDPAVTQYTVSRNAPLQNGSTLEATGARPRKPCNCTKSQCLKLYCDCFANGEFCQNCNCTNCANNLEHEEERSKAIKSCLDRNPQAFHPKIDLEHVELVVLGKSKDVEGSRRHTKGCNCKRSGCLKNYCECYEAKIMCSNFCKCIGCKNFEESPERKTLMHLADAAEVRVQQQTAAKTKLSSQISCVPSRPPAATASGERLPFALITSDVAEATSACLLAQAEEAERMKMPPVVQERMIIEEFGRCLMQIIESANRTRAASSLA